MFEVERKFQVFISSIYDDFKKERDAAYRAILQSGNIPVGMEYFPNGAHQMTYIKKLIDECDIFIIIIGNRYGTITQTGKSFIEDEYDYALMQDKHPISFFSNSIKKSYASKSLDEKFSNFIAKILESSGIVLPYKNDSMLENQIVFSIQQRGDDLRKQNAGWIRTSDITKIKNSYPQMRSEFQNVLNPLLESVKNEVLVVSANDNSASRRIIDSLYTSFCNVVSENSDPSLLEIGYWLTDIYERTGNFEKSLNIAEQLLSIIDSKSEWNYSNIRKMIGCTYSIAIAKEDDVEVKRNHLLRVNPMFLRLDKIINQRKDEFSNNERLILRILWNSDYAALQTNFYDLDKRTKTISTEDYLANALAYHNAALKLRKQLLVNYAGTESGEAKDVRIGIAQSTSNIGGVYYRLGDDLQALRNQNAALSAFKELKTQTREYAVMGYIIGIYLNMWSKIPATSINTADYKLCCNYAITLATEFYTKGEKNKARETNEKIVSLSNITSQSEEFLQIFNNVFSNLPFSLDWYLA